MICAGWSSSDDVRGLVVGVLDLELGGRWLRITGSLAGPDPDAGLPVVRPLEVTAIDEDGVIVPLTTEEVAGLRARFERAYYRWRGRVVYQDR